MSLVASELAEPVIDLTQHKDARLGIETIVRNQAYFHKRLHIIQPDHNHEKTNVYPGWQNDLGQFEIVWHTEFDASKVTQNAVMYIEPDHTISAGGLGLLYASAREKNSTCSKFSMSTRLNVRDFSPAYGFLLILYWLDLLRSTFYLFGYIRPGDVVIHTLTRSYPNRSQLTQTPWWRCFWLTDVAFTISGTKTATQTIESGNDYLLRYIRSKKTSLITLIPLLLLFVVYYWGTSIPWWNSYMPLSIMTRSMLSHVSIFFYVLHAILIAIVGSRNTTMPMWFVIPLAFAFPLYVTVLPVIIVLAKLTH